MAHKRVSLSLSPEVYGSLNVVAREMGVSRSALVNELLSEGLPALAEYLKEHGSENASLTSMRLRGASAETIRKHLDRLRGVLDSIDPDFFELTPCDDRPSGCSCDYSTGERIAPRGGCLVHGNRG